MFLYSSDSKNKTSYVEAHSGGETLLLVVFVSSVVFSICPRTQQEYCVLLSALFSLGGVSDKDFPLDLCYREANSHRDYMLPKNVPLKI